jgi:hypothetical protein
MPEQLTPLQLFVCCFALAAAGGVAALLRSGRSITWRSLLSAVLYSGLTGLVLGLVWYNYFDGQKNLFFLLGICGLAGLGGTTLMDLVVQVLSGGGITISLAAKERSSRPPKPPYRTIPDTEEAADDSRTS